MERGQKDGADEMGVKKTENTERDMGVKPSGVMRGRLREGAWREEG